LLHPPESRFDDRRRAQRQPPGERSGLLLQARLFPWPATPSAANSAAGAICPSWETALGRRRSGKGSHGTMMGPGGAREFAASKTGWPGSQWLLKPPDSMPLRTLTAKKPEPGSHTDELGKLTMPRGGIMLSAGWCSLEARRSDRSPALEPPPPRSACVVVALGLKYFLNRSTPFVCVG
jgi:hypothetical protein